MEQVQLENLKRAVRDSDIKAVSRLCKGGIDVNKCYIWPKKIPILHEAVENGNLEIAQVLISANAKVNSETPEGNSLLHIASRAGNTSMVQLLVKSGARVNAANEEYKTSMHVAMWRNHYDIVKYLIISGGSVNKKDCDGTSLLDWSVKLKNEEIMHFFINNSARLNPSDNIGRTPFLRAISNGDLTLAFRLLQIGANVNSVMKNGSSVFTFLAKLEYSKMQADSIWTRLRQKGKMPLEMVKCLIHFGANYKLINPRTFNIKDDDLLAEFEWLILDFQGDVRPLSQLTRLRIRQLILDHTDDRDISEGVDSLPIPNVVKEFIMFSSEIKDLGLS